MGSKESTSLTVEAINQAQKTFGTSPSEDQHNVKFEIVPNNIVPNSIPQCKKKNIKSKQRCLNLLELKHSEQLNIQAISQSSNQFANKYKKLQIGELSSIEEVDLHEQTDTIIDNVKREQTVINNKIKKPKRLPPLNVSAIENIESIEIQDIIMKPKILPCSQKQKIDKGKLIKVNANKQNILQNNSLLIYSLNNEEKDDFDQIPVLSLASMKSPQILRFNKNNSNIKQIIGTTRLR